MKNGGKLAWLLMIYSLTAMAQDAELAAQNPDSATPQNDTDTVLSAEFFEFLADYGTLDDNTFEIIEQHALRDSAKQPEDQ